MTEIRVIGDRDTVTGFRLAGAFGYHVSSAEEAQEAFVECTRNPDVGLVVITDHWAHRIEGQLRKFRRSRSIPLVIEIPSRYGNVQIQSQAERAKHLIGLAPAEHPE